MRYFKHKGDSNLAHHKRALREVCEALRVLNQDELTRVSGGALNACLTLTGQKQGQLKH